MIPLNALSMVLLVLAGVSIGADDMPLALFHGIPGGLLFGISFRRGCPLSRDYEG
jgi:hypothetical protein